MKTNSLISENVRGSEQVIGDIHALVSANAAGAKLIVEFMDEYEMHDLEILAGVIQNRAEQAMRDAVSKLPNGIFEGEIWGDGVEEPEKYPVKIEIDGDELTVDLRVLQHKKTEEDQTALSATRRATFFTHSNVCFHQRFQVTQVVIDHFMSKPLVDPSLTATNLSLSTCVPVLVVPSSKCI